MSASEVQSTFEPNGVVGGVEIRKTGTISGELFKGGYRVSMDVLWHRNVLSPLTHSGRPQAGSLSAIWPEEAHVRFSTLRLSSKYSRAVWSVILNITGTPPTDMRHSKRNLFSYIHKIT